MNVLITDSIRYAQAQKQLEALQTLKAPLYNTFSRVVCGNNENLKDAEFCFIDAVEAADQNKLKAWAIETGNTPGEMEAALEKQFNKLALLLEKYENQQRALQLSALSRN